MPRENYEWVVPDEAAIYTRPNSSKYQVRMKAPVKGGYIIKSTGKRDVVEARKHAQKMYYNLLLKIENKEEIKKKSFQQSYDLWWSYDSKTKSVSRVKYIEGTFRRYFNPYFVENLNNRSLEMLTDLDFKDYFVWRIDYWVSEAGKEKIKSQKNRKNNKGDQKHSKLGNVAKVPAYKTLLMEAQLLKQFFSWCHRRNLIPRQPYIKAPKNADVVNKEKARRPSFTNEEYKKLYEYMRGWVKEKNIGAQPRINGTFAKLKEGQAVKKKHALHFWHREQLRNYVLFMANSGLRPNEARQMRWGDIHWSGYAEKQFVKVRATTKTGERDTFPLPSAFTYLDRHKSSSRFTEDDDFVFCDHKGRPIQDFNKTLSTLLDKLGIKYDESGRKRSVYSLRHFYATQRLSSKDAKLEIEELAENMGTSPTTIFQHYRHISTHKVADKLTTR